MLQNSRNVLFEDQHKLKLENPEMSVESWMGHIDERKCSFSVKKINTGKNAIGIKKYGYQITTKDPLWPDCEAAVRSKGDFHMLCLQLEQRFPNAAVPKLTKSEVDNLHLMELFLTHLSLNPFFRMDVAFSDFLNGKFKEYKQTKKNDRKHSQGTLRWLQMNTEYKEVVVNEDFVRSLKGDLDQLERVMKTLVKAIAVQIKTLNELQNATNFFTESLGDFIAMEQASEGKMNGSISGMPTGVLRKRLLDLIGWNKDYLLGLKQSYDPGSLERLTADPITMTLKEITAVKKVLEVLNQAFQEFEKAKLACESVPTEDPNKGKFQETLALKEIIFFKQKRALGYEVERFRTYRTVNFTVWLANFVKFNLRGNTRAVEEWSKSGIRLDPAEETLFYQSDKVYTEQSNNPVGGRSRAMSLNATSKRKVKTNLKSDLIEMKSLEVTTAQNPGVMGGNYLKLNQGELVAGFQLESGDWQVTTATGKKGLAKASNVSIHNAPVNNNPKQQQNNTTFTLTAPQMPTFEMDGGEEEQFEDIEGGEEWSVSDGDEDHKGVSASAKSSNVGATLARPKPPTLPSLPPGLGGYSNREKAVETDDEVEMTPSNRNAPTPPLTKPPIPPASKPVESGTPPTTFKPMAPIPPASKPVENGGSAPSFGNPGTKPELPSFGNPGTRPELPTFGGAPPTGGPKPPTSAPQPKKTNIAPKPPAAASAPPPAAANTAPPPNPMKKLGGGGPSFLADIKKGNGLKQLAHVPDEEKSKEIGGEKAGKSAPVGHVVEPGQASKPRPPPTATAPSGGGGGLFGELSGKLNKRKV